MKRKILSIVGVFFFMLVFQSCSSKPEEGLLKRYFHALSLNDITTLSTMAIEPVDLEVESWKIVSIGEEEVMAAPLPELNKKELELKKSVEDSVGITLDARDALDNVKFELGNARTGSAKKAAQKKVDELQAKYDEVYENHKKLQTDYNEAKSAAAREEEITSFSLGAGELPNIRDFTGDLNQKTVEVNVKGKTGETKSYNIHLRKYTLKDDAMGMTRRGRWIIVDFVPVSK